jgi:hypothetical protein
MSLVYDKGKHRNSYDKNIPKMKLSNNNPINQLNIPKNNNKKNIIQNTHLFNEYISSSPIGNSNTYKAQFLTTYQNFKEMSNINPNNTGNIKNVNNKRPEMKKLNFNKSFEGNIGRDISKKLGLIKENIVKGKNNENKNSVNKSMVINHKNKKNQIKKNNKSVNRAINAHNTLNHKKNNLAEKLLIKKLEEKFKSLESNIIDKKYENEIDNEEMIITTKKDNYPNTARFKTKGNNKMLSNMINDNINSDFQHADNNFMDIILNKLILNTEYDFDENYLSNSSFENNRNDFNIMYTDNYGLSVKNDMLSLEIKLLIEKILEMQKSYHKELDLILGVYNKNSKLMKLLVEKIKFLQKKIFLIKKLKEKEEIKGNLYIFLEKCNHNNQNDIYKINQNEFYLWNYILYEHNRKNNDYNKEKLKEVFKKIIFERYNKIKGRFNNIENKIILNLMKKYNYNIKRKANGTKSNNIADIVISPNQRQIKNKNLNTNKNKKIISSNNNNNWKKHKKTSSCVQSKSTKYTYFKNNQKPK